MKTDPQNTNAFNLLIESLNDTTKLRTRLQKINPNSKDHNGRTILFYAPNLECAQTLITAGANPGASDHEGLTPLHVAKAEIVRFLIECGANTEAQEDIDLDTPLLFQLKRGNDDAAMNLIEGGANVDASNCELVTALHMAPLPVMRMLLDRNADIEAENDDGETPLHVHAFLGNFAVVELLLKKGANPSARKHDGSSVSDMARFTRHHNLSRLVDAHVKKKEITEELAKHASITQAKKRRM